MNELTRRYRVNISTSVKGVKSYDCTVEITSDCPPLNMGTVILEESDTLVAELDKRYPPTVDKP